MDVEIALFIECTILLCLIKLVQCYINTFTFYACFQEYQLDIIAGSEAV